MDEIWKKCIGAELQIMRIKLACDSRTSLFYCGLGLFGNI